MTTLMTLKNALTLLTIVTAAFTGAKAEAQCPAIEVTTGLDFPLGIAQTNDGNFVVSESGRRGVLHSGRLSIVDPWGNRLTLVDGLPSATNDVGDPSGPAGVLMRGRTLYVAIGIGDNVLAGPLPRTQVVNPNPSSPIFSSILAIHFSTHTERITSGFSLTMADHAALARGETVRLSNGGGDTIAIDLVTNLPDYELNPPPNPTSTVRVASNPFDLVAIADRLYVTDGGRNLVWQVDVPSGVPSTLVEFPTVPNPAFPAIGGPVVEAVPTGIRTYAGQLLVALFRGFPFPAGTSSVEQIDPVTGSRAPFIDGLKTAIDVLAVRSETVKGSHDFLVLQHASSPILFAAPGTLARIDGSSGAATVIAGCLNRPTSMARDARTGAVYITELLTGRLVVVQ
jgi:hypothetical protein